MKHKDGYEQFFEYFNIDKNDLWNFAKESIVTVDIDKAILQWNLIKSAIEEGTEPVIVRNYGLKGVNSGLYLDLYRHIVPNAVIKIDPTNNTYPPKILAKYTGYYKKSGVTQNRISNYQVSHIFERTRNPYSFGAVWNMAYIPKILDPFTGHEATGDLVVEFTGQLQYFFYDKYKVIIEEYNAINEQLLQLSREYVNSDAFVTGDKSDKVIDYFKKSIEFQFSKIEL